MANNVGVYGIRPATGKYASSKNPLTKIVATAYQANPGSAGNVDLNIFDPVIRVSDGSVAIATATGATFGVIVGVKQVYNSGIGAISPSNKVPGGTAWTTIDRQTQVLVLPVYGQYFEIDADAATATTLAGWQAFIGENCNLSYTVNTTEAKAYPRLATASHNTTNTLPWNIVDVSPTMLNQDYSGLYVKLIVQANVIDDVPVSAGSTGV